MKYMKQTETAQTKTQEAPQPVVLTHTALGTFKDELTGKWTLAKVRYNPTTKQVGEFEAISNEEGGREAINYRISPIKGVH